MEERLKKIILEQCTLEMKQSEAEKIFCNELDLQETLVFDSILMVQLVIELELEFNIEFELEILNIDVLKNYGMLKSIISKKMEERSDEY